MAHDVDKVVALHLEFDAASTLSISCRLLDRLASLLTIEVSPVVRMCD